MVFTRFNWDIWAAHQNAQRRALEAHQNAHWQASVAQQNALNQANTHGETLPPGTDDDYENETIRLGAQSLAPGIQNFLKKQGRDKQKKNANRRKAARVNRQLRLERGLDTQRLRQRDREQDQRDLEQDQRDREQDQRDREQNLEAARMLDSSNLLANGTESLRENNNLNREALMNLIAPNRKRSRSVNPATAVIDLLSDDEEEKRPAKKKRRLGENKSPVKRPAIKKRRFEGWYGLYSSDEEESDDDEPEVIVSDVVDGIQAKFEAADERGEIIELDDDEPEVIVSDVVDVIQAKFDAAKERGEIIELD